MGNLRASIYAVALVAFAGCGDSSDKPDAAPVKLVDAAPDARPLDAPPDASPFDFSCFGQPFPTTADPTITLAGTAQTLEGMALAPAPDVTIASYKMGDTPVNTTTSAADGTFTTGSITTGGTPLSMHALATKADYRPTYVFPPAPVTTSLTGVPVLIISNETFAGLVSLASMLGITQSDENGTLVLMVTDCAGMAPTGATISAKQGTTDVGMTLDASAFGFPGVFFVFDVPPGQTDVTAIVGTMTYPVHQVGIHAASDTITSVIPGPQN